MITLTKKPFINLTKKPDRSKKLNDYMSKYIMKEGK